jgi:Flp pilus assembly protein TadG
MRRLLACRRGAAALEFALVAPLLLTMLAGTVELARWGWGAAALRSAAAEGARCVRVARGCTSPDAVRALLAEAEPVRDVSFEKSACGVRITATGGYKAALVPGLAETRAHACAP